MSISEIPASWVEGYVEPDYDECLELMEEADLNYREEIENKEMLRAWYYKGVM